MDALLALILGALCPIWTPAPTPVPKPRPPIVVTTTVPDVITISEGFHEPFDIDPPTRLDVLLGGDPTTMLDRCDHMGGALADEGRCAGVDY